MFRALLVRLLLRLCRMKRMIPAELASNLCFESSHEDFPGWKQRDQVDGDNRRWTRTNTTIIEDPEGNFLGFQVGRRIDRVSG